MSTEVVNQDVSDAPRENTLDNLEDNIAAEMTQTDVNSGEPAGPDSTQQSGQPDAAKDVKVSEKEAEVDTAKMHRISQKNADMRNALRKFGIDPDSDTLEQLNEGVITPDEILNRPMAPKAPEQPAPELSLADKIARVKQVIEKPIGQNGVSAEDYKDTLTKFAEALDGLAQENQTIKIEQEQREQKELANRLIVATNDVFNTNVMPELTSEIPEEVKDIASEMFLGATEIENIDLIRIYGHQKASTPEGYSFSAKKVAPRITKLIKAIYKAGQDSKNPNPPRNPVNPLRPGAGGGMPPPPADKTQFTIENLEANVDKYLSSQEAQV